jgi:hypothetical protein
MAKDTIKSTLYDLGGFIKVLHSPILNEYTVCMRKNASESKNQWFVCNNRGTIRLSTAELFKDKTEH